MNQKTATQNLTRMVIHRHRHQRQHHHYHHHHQHHYDHCEPRRRNHRLWQHEHQHHTSSSSSLSPPSSQSTSSTSTSPPPPPPPPQPTTNNQQTTNNNQQTTRLRLAVTAHSGVFCQSHSQSRSCIISRTCLVHVPKCLLWLLWMQPRHSKWVPYPGWSNWILHSLHLYAHASRHHVALNQTEHKNHVA